MAVIDFNLYGSQHAPRPKRTPPTRADVEDRALAELKAHGLIPENVVADGAIHRCPTEAKPHSKNGWYILYFDEWPDITFADWGGMQEKTTVKLYEDGGTLTYEERQRAQEAWERHMLDREEKRSREADKAAKKAAADLAEGRYADKSFPYLAKKGVLAALGLKVKRCRHPVTGAMEDALLIPLQNAQGNIRTYQRIFADGTKRHLYGGEKKGAYFLFQGCGANADLLAIGEGYSTCATIAEAMPGISAISVCDCGNFDPVLQGLKDAGKLNPEKTLIVADNDHATAGNPGMTKARQAAEKFGCKWTPAVPEGSAYADGTPCTDANDLFMAKMQDCLSTMNPDEARAKALETVKTMLQTGWSNQPPVAPLEKIDPLDRLDDCAPRQGIYEGPPPPYNWLFEGLLEQGELAVLAGPGGSGKSTAALQGVFAAGIGRPWLYRYDVGGEPGEAWYLSSEDSYRTLHRKADAIMDTLTPAERGLARRFVRLLHVPSRYCLLRQDSRTRDVVPTEYWQRFREKVMARRPRLIVIDPISSLTLVTEGDNTAMTEALGYLEELGEESDTCIMYLHHVTKAGSLLKEPEDIAERLDQTAIRGAGAIVNVPRCAMLLYPLSVPLAKKCLEDGEAVKSNGQIVTLAEVKKNGGILAPPRFFRHTSNMGLLEPCLNVRSKFDFSDKDAGRDIEKLQKQEGNARLLAEEAVRREQSEKAKKRRISPTNAAVEIGATGNREKSNMIAAKAVVMGLVHIVNVRDLVEHGFAAGRTGGGRVVVPSIEALRKYGQPDPDRPGEWLNVSAELRQWIEAECADDDPEAEAVQQGPDAVASEAKVPETDSD